MLIYIVNKTVLYAATLTDFEHFILIDIVFNKKIKQTRIKKLIITSNDMIFVFSSYKLTVLGINLWQLATN